MLRKAITIILCFLLPKIYSNYMSNLLNQLNKSPVRLVGKVTGCLHYQGRSYLHLQWLMQQHRLSIRTQIQTKGSQMYSSIFSEYRTPAHSVHLWFICSLLLLLQDFSWFWIPWSYSMKWHYFIKIYFKGLDFG